MYGKLFMGHHSIWRYLNTILGPASAGAGSLDAEDQMGV